MNSTSSIGSSANSTALTYEFPSSGTTNAAGRRRTFSAGVAWFLGIMLLVVGAVVSMQGTVIFGVVAVVAGLAAVAWAAVALMS